MKYDRRSRVICLTLLIAVLGGSAGCTAVGEKTFACPGRPAGVRCMSATEVYAATENSDYVDPTAARAIGNDPKALREQKKKRSPRTDSPQSSHPIEHGPEAVPGRPELLLTATQLPGTDKPVPIRTPAQVMRVWLAPWEDQRGVLHAGGYSFMEIESRQWMLGEASISTEPARYFSIQAVTRTSAPASTAKESGKKSSAAASARTEPKERAQKPKPSTPPAGDSK